MSKIFVAKFLSGLFTYQTPKPEQGDTSAVDTPVTLQRVLAIIIIQNTEVVLQMLRPNDGNLNTFAASYLNTQGLNNSCLKSPASTLVDLTFQSRALRYFSLNQLSNLSL